MNKHFLTRAISLVLTLAMFCSLLVFPAAAAASFQARLAFTKTDGTSLTSSGTLTSGETIRAKLMTAYPVDVTAFDLTFTVDTTKATVTKKAYSDLEFETVAGSLPSDTTDKNTAVLIIGAYTADQPVTWATTQALVYFDITLTADVNLSDLPSVVQIAASGTVNGIEDCTTEITNNRDIYDVTYNVCPYMTVGHSLNQGGSVTKFNTNTTVGDLKKALSIQAYTAAGVLSHKADSVRIYTDSSKSQLLEDETVDLDQYLQEAGTNRTGTFYVEVTTADGATLGKELTVTLPKDEIDHIAVEPVGAGYEFTYSYDSATSTGGFTLDSGSYTVKAYYKSAPTTAKTLKDATLTHGHLNAGADQTITVTYNDGTKNYQAELSNVSIAQKVVPLPTAVTTSYTGSEQTVSWADDTFKQDYYTVTAGDKQTNAGDHDVTLTLNDKDNVKWADSENETHTVNWTINKATGYLKVEQKGDIYTSTRIEDITDLSKNYLQTVANPNNPGTLTKPNGTITLTSDGSSFYPNGFTFGEGTHTVHYKFTADNANYADVTGTLTLKVKGRTVTSIVVGGTLKKTEYTYGQEFDPDGLTVTATYSDGTTGDVTSQVTWTKDLGGVGTNKEVTGNFDDKTINLPTGTVITVNPKELTASDVTLSVADVNAVYNGSVWEPDVTVTYGGKQLTKGTDYEIEYSNNTRPGTATAKIVAKSGANYTFANDVSTTFGIAKKEITISNTVRTSDGSLAVDKFEWSRAYNGTDEIADKAESRTLVGVVSGDQVTLHVGTMHTGNADAGTYSDAIFKDWYLKGTAKDNYNLLLPTKFYHNVAIDRLTIDVKDLVFGNTNKEYDSTADSNLTVTIPKSKLLTVDQDKAEYANGIPLPVEASYDSADAGDRTINYKLPEPPSEGLTRNYKAQYGTKGTVNGKITQRNIDKNNYDFGAITVIKGKGEFTDPTFTTAINSSDVSITTGALSYNVGETTYTHDQLVDHLKTQDKGTTVNATVSATATGNFTGTVSGTITFNVVDIIFKLDGTEIGADNQVFWFKNSENGNVYNMGNAGDYFKINGSGKVTASVNGQNIDGNYYFVFESGDKDAKVPAGNHTFRLLFDSTAAGYSYTGVQVGRASQEVTINKRPVTLESGVTVTTKEYDGDTTATVSTANAVINGKLGNDELTLTAGNAMFDTKNAGKNKQVTVTLTLAGTDAANYRWSDSDDPAHSYKTTGEITPKGVTITGVTVDASRAYDGKRSATIDATHAVISGKIGNDDVDIKYGTATYADKNVGTGKTVTFSDFSLKGADKDNYNLTAQPAPTTANITAKELRITNFTVKDKVYDGNDIAEIVSIETDAVEGDDVKCSNAIARFVASGTFSASDAQNGKKVTLKFPQGVILAGADKDNYTFDSADLPDEVTATIHKATLTGQPTFTKITQSGKTLLDIKDSDVDLTAIHGVSGEPNPLYPVLIWGEDRNTVIQPNKSYSWEVKVAGASADNYLPLTGSVVLYPVSTGYSEQVKKQIEEFEAKKRGELPEEDTTFRDVSEDDYFFDAVNWAAENGITGGVSANRFGPTQDCSRGQTMTFLWRAMGEPEPASRASDLTDVMTGSYYYDAVLWAMEAGITTGAGANRFAPDATVTRGQFVTFLYRLANASSDGVHPFTDVPAGSYYEKAIAWAYAEGITKGTGATTFSPDAPCTRAQIITFLYRYFNR